MENKNQNEQNLAELRRLLESKGNDGRIGELVGYFWKQTNSFKFLERYPDITRKLLKRYPPSRLERVQ